MAYTTIDKPSDYFNTKIYTGTGSDDTAITGIGFQPDWVWVKNRGASGDHALHDAVRGVTKRLDSNTTDAESTTTTGVKSFDSDGFTLGTAGNYNTSSGTYVAWNWLAGNGTASNSNGSITSTVSANTTAGFSIVTWTGSGSDATIGHGLSSAPEMYVVKNRSDSANWRVGQTVAGNTMTGGNGYYMEWDDTKASTNPGSATTWGSTPTAPTSSVFTVGSNNAHNGSSDNMLAYCFHSVKGYSKIGSYIGNGNANGTFVYTGFKPAWIIGKATSRADVWWMYDTKRSTFNPMDDRLMTQASSAEGEEWDIDYLSNGFKVRSTDAQANGSAETYFYMAFAEAPFATVGTKAAGTAR
jgi:hypothetical protein